MIKQLEKKTAWKSINLMEKWHHGEISDWVAVVKVTWYVSWNTIFNKIIEWRES